MRRLFMIALSLLALGDGAWAADLPPAPQLPPLEAQPLWTGFYAGLNVGGGFGSSRNAFTVAGLGLPSFTTSLDGVIGGGEARLQLADGPMGSRARSQFRGERA
jgi:outer membrane immunogenic protein